MRGSIIKLTTTLLVSMSMMISCSVSEIPELETQGTLPSSIAKQQLTQTQTTITTMQADSNISFSVIKDGAPLALDSNDKVIFELRNNTLEIVYINRLAEKQENCPEHVKASAKDEGLLICNSYIQKMNLTDIVVFKGSQRLEVASWVFEDKTSDLMRLKIKLR